MKSKKKKLFLLTTILSVFALLFAIIGGAADYSIPARQVITESIDISNHSNNVNNIIDEVEAEVSVFGVPLKNVTVDVIPKIRLIPCGDIFGVKFFTKGVMIVGMSDIESDKGILNPAYKSGLRVGDNIISLNNCIVNTVEEVADIVENCKGQSISVEFERDGVAGTTNLIPLKSLTDGKFKSGLWVRDSTAGIGTITYYNPDTGEFAGLGHGICDIDTGKLMPMLKGNIVDIGVKDIIRGIEGTPGEIKGEFGIVKKGDLTLNSERGVFGYLYEKPNCAFTDPMEIASQSEVNEGSAYIYASLGTNKINQYEIELTKIYHNDSATKNFIFTVKDKTLLDKTGGIVQGMSGSPIVQNGKLIGAVTHVLVNDPTRGYGIFIENMLSEANRTK